MSIESELDWIGLRAVGRIVRMALEEMRRALRPGVTTAEVARAGARVLEVHGARHAPRYTFDFPGDSCISVNDEAVHGIPGPRVLGQGDLVKLDLVAEKDGYHADAAVTVSLDPQDRRGQALIACADAALAAGIAQARVGNPVHRIGAAIEREVRRHGFTVLRELAGHGTGRSIHEEPVVPNYFERTASDVLTPGLVLAIEPIIAERSGAIVEAGDGWTIRTADGALAAHAEHTIVVTRRGPVVLTAG